MSSTGIKTTVNRFISLILLLICIPNTMTGQSCLPDGIRFTSQADIDNFAATYPGCTVIEGDVCIGNCESILPSSDITNLNGLSQLTQIKGKIEIAHNDQLLSLVGLQNLSIIESDLIIEGNTNLSTLNGLGQIEKIKGSLILKFNCSCLQLNGLQNVKTIGGNMIMEYGSFNGLYPMVSIDSIYGDLKVHQTWLKSFAGISSLQYLGGSLILTSSLIENLSGLDNLTEIFGDIYLTGNLNPMSMYGLRNVTKVHGNFTLSGNTGFINLSQMTALREIGGNLSCYQSSSPHLLTNLERVGGGFSYSGNNSLTQLLLNSKLKFIGGGLSINGHHSAKSIDGFEMLDTVVGQIFIHDMFNLLSTPIFPNLKYSGRLTIWDNRALEFIPDLNKLQYLGGVSIQGNQTLTKLPDFPLVNIVNGDFIIHNNSELVNFNSYENIRHITGLFQLDNNGKIKVIDAFHNLTSVGKDVIIQYNFDLDSLDAFTQLDSIGGALNLNLSAVQNFPQDNTFEFIGSGITFQSIPGLIDLQCLRELDSIHGSLQISLCNNLNSLAGIQQLSHIGGGLKLSINKLPDLSGLANLEHLGGSLEITFCHMLTSLSGLENLQLMNGRLNISNNQNLVSLQGINHIDPSGIESGSAFIPDIQISNNVNLNTCNEANICAALRDERKSFLIEKNLAGCNDVRELDCKEYGLTGVVYLDQNENKQKDMDEVGIPGMEIDVLPGNKTVITDQEGHYLFLAEEGVLHTLQLDLNPDWILITDSLEFRRRFEPGAASNKDISFGIIPLHDKVQLEAHIVSEPTRCNQNVRFQLRYYNGGTRKVNGEIRLQYDVNTEFVSASISPDNHDHLVNELIWEFDSIRPFTHENMEIVFGMPDETHTGELLQFNLGIFYDSTGTLVKQDEEVFTPVLLCSFDPNDKIVMPTGVKTEKFTDKDELLMYTVRFQNTGNAPAIDVSILDTVSAHLDISTFSVINSSHQVFTTIDGHAVQFLFPNIWLPDSLSSEPESHGFVSYEIQPLSGVPDETLVQNTADIIFDSNPPVITNTTLNTMVEEICMDITTTIDTVLCPGETFLGHSESGQYLDTVSIGITCDSFSILHIDFHTAQTITIDTAICDGETFLGQNTPGLFTYDSLNLVTGCLDQYVVTLEIIQAGESGCITGIHKIPALTFELYPNPANTSVMLKSLLPVHSTFLITAQGERMDIAYEPLDLHHQRIDLSDGMPAGFYILEVWSGEQKHYLKLMIVGK